ncbi:MAG: VOC family protein [Haliangiales bacterium]
MDHISLPISDVTRSKTFYEATLAPLGWACSGWRDGLFVGFKKPGAPALYLNVASATAPAHLAFKAETEAEVQAFFQAGQAAGGVDNGAPGPRTSYGPSYYAAFLLDPDGHNIEAVVGGVG